MRNKSDKALNPDLWENLLCLLDAHDVNFVWVKGHASNVENERCDFLAVNHIKSGELEHDHGYNG